MSSTSTPTAGSTRAVTEPFEESHHRPRMQDHVVFVTGGSRGIGAAICRSFAEQGAVVAAGYSGNEERAQQLYDPEKQPLQKLDLPVRQPQRRPATLPRRRGHGAAEHAGAAEDQRPHYEAGKEIVGAMLERISHRREGGGVPFPPVRGGKGIEGMRGAIR